MEVSEQWKCYSRTVGKNRTALPLITIVKCMTPSLNVSAPHTLFHFFEQKGPHSLDGQVPYINLDPLTLHLLYPWRSLGLLTWASASCAFLFLCVLLHSLRVAAGNWGIYSMNCAVSLDQMKRIAQSSPQSKPENKNELRCPKIKIKVRRICFWFHKCAVLTFCLSIKDSAFVLAYVYHASVPVFVFLGPTQSGFDKHSCILCTFLIDDWFSIGHWGLKEVLLELKCCGDSFILERGLVEEAAPCWPWELYLVWVLLGLTRSTAPVRLRKDSPWNIGPKLNLQTEVNLIPGGTEVEIIFVDLPTNVFILLKMHS